MGRYLGEAKFAGSKVGLGVFDLDRSIQIPKSIFTTPEYIHCVRTLFGSLID